MLVAARQVQILVRCLPRFLGWEDVIQADCTLGRLRRSEVIGTVAGFPTRRLAMQVLSQRLRSVNSGKARPHAWSPPNFPHSEMTAKGALIGSNFLVRTDPFASGRHPSRVDAKRGDHFLQADAIGTYRGS
jgi:hypothetical protein